MPRAVTEAEAETGSPPDRNDVLSENKKGDPETVQSLSHWPSKCHVADCRDNEVFSKNLFMLHLKYCHLSPKEPMSDCISYLKYKMHKEDGRWLRVQNKKRESSGLVKVSTQSFELLMGRLELESYFLEEGVNSSLAVPNDGTVCSICLVGKTDSYNVILSCDLCKLAVHQDCYGVPFILEKQWLCRRCTDSPSCEVKCELCPNNCGAFKQTDRGAWAHVLCASWIPQVGFENNVFLERINGIETIPTASWKLTCYVCNKREGAFIQCYESNCYKAFHVTCAQQAGLCLGRKTLSNLESIEIAERRSVSVLNTAFCDAHAPVDYLNKSSGEQSSEEKLYIAKQVLAINRSTGPVLSKPTIPPERVKIIENLLSIPERSNFVEHLIAFWTKKRHLRRGGPLLPRLLPYQIFNTVRRKELLKLFSQLQCCQDTKGLRLLCDSITKLVGQTKQTIFLDELTIPTSWWPFNFWCFFLHSVLQQLVAIDDSRVFIKFVDQNSVLNYGEEVEHPMDLESMEIKINNCEYTSFRAFECDFNLMILYYYRHIGATISYKSFRKMKEQGGIIMRAAKQKFEILKFGPVTLTLAENSPKDTAITTETQKVIKDDEGTKIDCESRDTRSQEHTMDDDDKKEEEIKDESAGIAKIMTQKNNDRPNSKSSSPIHNIDQGNSQNLGTQMTNNNRQECFIELTSGTSSGESSITAVKTNISPSTSADSDEQEQKPREKRRKL